jgi:hypothetical protein
MCIILFAMLNITDTVTHCFYDYDTPNPDLTTTTLYAKPYHPHGLNSTPITTIQRARGRRFGPPSNTRAFEFLPLAIERITAIVLVAVHDFLFFHCIWHFLVHFSLRNGLGNLLRLFSRISLSGTLVGLQRGVARLMEAQKAMTLALM